MKRSFFLILVGVVILFLGIGFGLRKTILKSAMAGLQVKSNPQSAVFLNGKDVGQTPFEGKEVNTGEVTLKLVPQGDNLSSWETKVKLVSGTQTIVNREFGQTESASAGEVMTLEKISDKKTASLAIISSPDSALVEIGGESKGFTPISLDKLEEADREINVSASGFTKRTIRVKLLSGYKLILNVKLAEEKSEEISESLTPTPSPSGGPTPTSNPKASPTPKVTTTPTPTVKPKGISVRVLNGSGIVGAAAKVADFLKSLGYEIAGTGNASNYNYEKTEISAKKSQTLLQLQTDLEDKYEIGTASAVLSATESADAVVIVGKK